MNDITRSLVRYVLESKPEDIPASVQKDAKRSLINFLGCSIGGAQHETVEKLLAATQPFSGPAQAAVLGRKERLDILSASLVNGTSSAVLDFDATQAKKTNIHPSGPAAPVCLALAELTPISGKDFLHAFILGVEIECRIANTVFGSTNPGWHVTSVCGGFGAAAAAGRMLGLNEQQLVWAFGIAANQAGGIRENYGTMVKSFAPGTAARNGLSAALMAQQGFVSDEHALEGPKGFAVAMTENDDLNKLTENLGKDFEISYNTYKAFACGIVTHATVDGCVQLRNEHNLSQEQIVRVSLKVSHNTLLLTGKEKPSTGLEGKFSVYHAAAIALIDGTAGEAQFTDDRVHNPDVIALRNCVQAEAVDGIGKYEAFIAIDLDDGTTLEKHITHALGSLDNPMGDDEIAAKYWELVSGILPDDQSEALIDLCWSIDTLDNAGNIARAAAKK
ncbi:MAG: MmgE/PrpD family protein [Rhodospirillales bacterium]|jgi:2-methylcitrate dehydratase PrpD